MRRLFSIASLTIVALTFSQQAQAATKAKTGYKCSKVSATQTVGSREFTCVKSGSKLIWNKGTKVAKPIALSPPAEPNPFKLSLFPDEFTRVQMVDAVFESFNKFKKVNSKSKSFKLVIGAEYQSDSVVITNFVNDIYSVLQFPTDYPTTIVVVSGDKNLVEQSIEKYGQFDRTGSRASDWHVCLNCAGLGWASISRPNIVSSTTPHEIFHIWQKSVYKRVNDNNPDPSNFLNPPVWFDEGGASFFGEIMSSKISNKYIPPKVGVFGWKLKNYATRDMDPYLPYSLGQLASEYIVASRGMDKFLAIYSNVGAGQDFPSAFENSLGISLSNFYEKFDKNLQKML